MPTTKRPRANVTNYFTRNMRRDLLERLHALAAVLSEREHRIVTVEEALNRAVEAGLNTITRGRK